MMVINTVDSFGLDGRVAEETLDKVSITTNKQIIPDDPNPPLRPSGIRLGTPAATARGMQEAEMLKMADWIVDCLQNSEAPDTISRINSEVAAFCESFPVPGIE
jgi:glycine hydroxymethyltransferase